MSTTAPVSGTGVNGDLTPNLARAREGRSDGPSRREPVETMEFAAMLERMHAAYVRRVAEGDPEDLAVMIRLADDLQASVGRTVRLMRAKLGWSWGDLAKAVPSPVKPGEPITRQALQSRYGAPADV